MYRHIKTNGFTLVILSQRASKSVMRRASGGPPSMIWAGVAKDLSLVGPDSSPYPNYATCVTLGCCFAYAGWVTNGSE